CVLILRLTPLSTLFPYTTLFRSYRLFTLRQQGLDGLVGVIHHGAGACDRRFHDPVNDAEHQRELDYAEADGEWAQQRIEIYRLRDRKTIRLNSSHVKISYAVFCL